MALRRSVLFISPDYHCSFAYRDELRRIGWKADIYVGNSYPDRMLYSEDDVLRPPRVRGLGRFGRILNAVLERSYYLAIFWRYKYHFYYAGVDWFRFHEDRIGLNKLFGDSFRINLWLAKKLHIKIIDVPSGCMEEELQANFIKLDSGNVCNNCGYRAGICNDRVNASRFDLLRRYADIVIGQGTLDSTQYAMTHCKYKAIDLELWRPDLEVPEEFKLPPTNAVRIMHSFWKQGREHAGKNIKGSPFVLAAVDRLKREGYDVEYFYVTDVHPKNMRYYQAQADIIVEQLIYGWWGSTFVEGAALGKPVVCYLRPAWKEFFLRTFDEYAELPVVEANTSSIYAVLKRLVTDPDYRKHTGHASRVFAETHFNPKANVQAMTELIESLPR